ncbi:MAG: hypothetical protein OHK0022_14850 [Roseiflexaceae bacterium]
MITPTVDQILHLANQLPREQRRLLLTRLEQEFATEAPPQKPTMTQEEARAAWAQLRADLSARPAGPASMAEQLDADRRSRDDVLRGAISDESDDVHT